MSNIAIKIENISKKYRIGKSISGTLRETIVNKWKTLTNRKKVDIEDFWALKDISFEVKQGEVLGIIGKNGAGKSTLLKVLSRITEPTYGRAIIYGRVSSLLEVGTGFHPELTGRENIFLNGTILGMSRKEVKLKFDNIVDFSGVEKFIDTPVKHFSSGMYVRLAFAVAAHLEPETLIIDEVLSVGDAEFQKKCIGKMGEVAKDGRTVLFVSHNMASMKTLCQTGILLTDGKVAYNGLIGQTIENYMSTVNKTTITGDIPLNASSINTGIAKFSKFMIIDNNNIIENVYYLSPIYLYFELFSTEYIPDYIIDIRINTIDGIELVHCMNKYSKINTQAIKKGKNIIYCKLINQLQPGKYSFTIGIHLTNGATLDFVENIMDFNVLSVAAKGDSGFIYNWKLGQVRFESEWRVEN